MNLVLRHAGRCVPFSYNHARSRSTGTPSTSWRQQSSNQSVSTDYGTTNSTSYRRFNVCNVNVYSCCSRCSGACQSDGHQPVAGAQTSTTLIPSAPTTLIQSVTPVTASSSTQDGLSSSATISLSTGPSASTTLTQSVTPATTPPSTQDGLSSSATISLSAGPSASARLLHRPL